MQEKEIPAPPIGGLNTRGKKVWERLWGAPNVALEDYDTILLACKLTEERLEYEAYFKKNQRFLWINNNTNLVVHPFIKRIQEIDKLLESLYSALGLNPMARSKMKLELQKEADAVDKLKKNWLDEAGVVYNDKL